MEKSICSWNLFKLIDTIVKSRGSISNEFSRFLSKQIWSPEDRSEILIKLSCLFVKDATLNLGLLGRPLLLDLVWRCRLRIENSEFCFQQHQDFCIALTRCLHWPDIQRFALDYVLGKPSFIHSDETHEPKRKKARKSQENEESVIQAAWLFARYLGDESSHVTPLKDLMPYLTHDNQDVRWFACQAVMEQQKLSSNERRLFLNKYFSEQTLRELKIRHQLKVSPSSSAVQSIVDIEILANQLSHTHHVILESDLCEKVTCIGGVLLSKVAISSENDADLQFQDLNLLPVPSNEVNLHSLALAVSSGSPVLLQGVVGSGKTSLVEHLARLTGRFGPPALMKIQMGDQMDSKALLGTYRCTEIPGEFVWQPGVLTQAVTHGYWVLMEDIDYAPMEVISVLLPLLETRTLSVPGHGDSISAAPGFHLFATQRLLSGSTGWNKQQNSNSALLDKLWTSILVEPLSRTELSKVLCVKYPSLETVVEKLLDIYFLLSAGGHQGASVVAMETEAESVGKFLSHDGRQISTRDLMTWCRRISKDFDVSSSGTGNFVFLEALDCFVACLSKREKRIPLAEAVGAKLNITKVKVEYFNDRYKPDTTVSTKSFTVGRVTLPVKETSSFIQSRKKCTFSYTRQSSVLLERVAVCVSNQEPVLLVGETGTGKTSTVQYLAEQLGHKLHVINMNQQSDSADLLGGFKPVDVRQIIKPFYEDFELLFCKSFSRKQNAKFLGHLQNCFGKRKWENLFSLMEHTTKSALEKFEKESKFLKKWQKTSKQLLQLKTQVHQTQNALAFTFMEGTLVKAIRSGDWVLLDEINLAAMETLECLSGLLERTTGSVLLMERGDVEPVKRHPDFRLFACMNPATDVGKKDLSPGIRNRFTEVYVDELEDPADLKILVCDYLQGLSLTAAQVDGIVKFYLTIRSEASKKLTDGTGHPPHYSLRTLCRALRYAAKNACGSVPRSLYEGFCLSFLTQLDRSSHPVVQHLVCQHVLGKSNVKSVLKQAMPMPPGGRSLNFEGYWIFVGDHEPCVPDDYILTPSVRANLKDLARVVAAGQHPVLLQGETSVGKTSLIKWLAQSTGNTCVRVNNHEHTDLQEYVGCYAADESGKLAFKEGVLVEAMKKGHWIILDELNLAPTDVLEALNRLLDDNRELYIPETQETVKAHGRFMLFATQNPPGQYGGRKMLSRAFRNRFVELHFDQIPSKELETILHERCNIPLSYARRLVAVMLELQTRRRGSGVFAGKMGFMTLRDLFRWAGRYTCPEMDGKKFYNWDKHLADQGYMLLAGRVRKPEEADVIQEVIQKHFKCKLSAGSLFTLNTSTSLTSKSTLESVIGQSAEGFHHVVWTYNMRRLAVLIGQAIRYKEPVLLVGETGCGKTTMCQLFAGMYKSSLHSVNCHLHTESADFLGGLRPVRAHSEEDKKDKLFEWVDGPLVEAMKGGAMFLIDEISLADDSVLERLNSVLELERTILLAEKGGGDGNQNEVEHVVAKEGFHVFATMNPGGDFGKKELSPALRNRFTEIWCPPSSHRQDMIDIIEHNLHSGIHLCNQEDGTSGFGRAMMDFVEWFRNNELGKRCTVSIRDILTWVQFINTCSKTVESEVAMETEEQTCSKLDPAVAYIHGACLVFLDGLGAGLTSQGKDDGISQLRTVCLAFLLKQVNSLTHQKYDLDDLHLLDNNHVNSCVVMETEKVFSIPPFSIPKGDRVCEGKHQYALKAPGTCLNAQRVLRALQLPRPLLLEGSPGVGKTSLVGAIARAAGRELVRINLSEQTDVTDLFGADLPVEGSEGGTFAWRDGPLLQALKAGSWIVLDELNLASQSVLEGLNACLDHRAEVYIPELGKTFHIQHEKTRLFACQNPLNQGGGRKGLPRSFLNRFTQVYVEPLKKADLMFIATTMYPSIPQDILNYMVVFNMQIYENTVVKGLWGQKGSPWEFNLRDLFRWCDLLIENQKEVYNPGEYVGLVYAERMRTAADKQQVYELYRSIFPADFEAYRPTKVFHHGGNTVQIGHSFLKVKSQGHLQKNRSVAMEMLHHSLQPLESLMTCVEMNWMAILVGPSNCGKSSIVEMLAQLSGNRLNVLPMNSAMDTTELLGGFEQADDNRHLEELVADVHTVLNTVCEQCLLSDDQGFLETVAKLQELWTDIKKEQLSGEKRSNMEEIEAMKCLAASLLNVLVICKKSWKKMGLNGETFDKICSLKPKIENLKHKLSLAVAGQGGGAFEWIDSLLVTSLREGHWLLIDNVNFCSASVLDRLNALLEPHGVLSVNERGVIDGEIPTIRPHPDFRLFLCMDPRHGEISRAMRNRGVEIFVPGEVGPSNCGKSSIVEMLAQLSGNRLNVLPMNSAMDTTELLGGFEQADDNRHLEELVADVHTVLNTVCEQCLLSDDQGFLETVAKLQELWTDIKKEQLSGEKRSNMEEIEAMKCLAASLLNVLVICKKSWKKMGLNGETFDKICSLKPKIENLKHKLSLAVAGQGGGAFEWIDSLLVTSLREGHWLLIDNVNFCSASVLDRLNALLEPHGVLSVNERGVIDGEIPTIRPHPDFRLFLCMDPRHGEISRAMRNRGVEIFVPGEENGQLFSNFDLRQIFSSLGLKSKPVFDWLFHLHGDLVEELPRGDKPSEQSLLQVCRQAVQQCNHGNNLEKSLKSACYSVYVQTQRHMQSKQKALEILNRKCESLHEVVSGDRSDPELGVSPVKLPGVAEYTKDSTSALVVRNVAVFVHLLEQRRLRGNGDFDLDLKLKHALNLLLQLSTRTSLPLTVDWVQNFCKIRNQSEEIDEYGVSSLSEICRLVMVTIETDCKETLWKFTENCANECPLDLRWNKQLFEKFTHEYKGSDAQELKKCIEIHQNRIHILQKFLVNLNRARRHQDTLQKAVLKEKSTRKQTSHAAVGHLAALFPQLTSAVTDLLQKLELLSYDQVILVLESLQWLPRLYETAASTLNSPEAGSRLPLFWKWLYNKLLCGGLIKLSECQNVMAVVSILQGILGKDDRKWKRFIKSWRSWGHPRPYSSEEEGKLTMKALRLFKLLDLDSSTSELLNSARVKLITSRQQLVLDAAICLLGGNESEHVESKEKAIFVLQEMLMEYGLLNKEEVVPMETDVDFTSRQSDETERQTDLPLKFVQLWPLFEYSSVLESWRILCNQTRTQLFDLDLEALVDYSACFTPASLTHISLLKALGTKEEVSLPTVLGEVLCRIRTSCATDNTMHWLEWSESISQEPSASFSNKKLNIHQSVLSYMLCTLLSRADHSATTISSNVKISAPLKSYTREITQLSHVSRHIWSHMDTYSKSSKQTLTLDKASLCTALIHTLKSCKPFIDTEHIAEVNKTLDAISVETITSGDLENIVMILEKYSSKLDKTCTDQLQNAVGCVQRVIKDKSQDLGTLGVAWISLAQFAMNLLAPQGPVDPVEKVAIKLNLLKDELLEVDTELEVLCMHHRMVTGQELTEVSSRLLHPRIVYLMNKTVRLKEQMEQLEKQVAYRPTPSQYNQLVTDIKNFTNTVSSVENVQKLVTRLQGHRSRRSKNMAVIQEVELWQRSQEKFIDIIESEYPLYRDIITPFLSAVYQMVHGMSVLSLAVRQEVQLVSLGMAADTETKRQCLEKLVVWVGKFPTLSWQQPSCLDLAMTLISDASLSLMKAALDQSKAEEMDLQQVASESVLSSCLFSVHNAAKVRKELTSDLVMTLTKILEMYVLSWQQAEEKRKLQEEEQASLYRYKSQVHGDERSEEEKLETEFEENFPQFTQEFADLVGPKAFEDSAVPVEGTENILENASLKVSSTQMTQICQVHQKLYKHLVNTDWYHPIRADSLQLHDWIRPILSSYTSSSILIKHLTDVLSSKIDCQMLGGHLVVSAVQQFYILQASKQCDSPLVPEPNVYDIYHDTNVPEVTQCLPVINGLRVRVMELQEEWPDHPTLKQLCEISDRIEGFPITSPVMKFLTGLELLLQKAQDWESNASQHVSMATQLADISRQIVQWRKLELSCWMNALDTELHKYRSDASKWWFHLYQVVMSAVQSEESVEASSVEEVIKSLKQFIEHSTLGDFQTRLEMLLSFHCHLVTMATCGSQSSSVAADDQESVAMEADMKKKELQNVLWNMHQFYSRFCDTVQSELDRLRSPIEKELKGFVKIARWTDINYWALKQTTEKTHRTLHKHVKQFQGVLQQTVKGILGDIDDGVTSSGADHSSWSEKLSKYQEDVLYQLRKFKVTDVPPPALCSVDRFPLQHRLVHLCSRLNKHWKQIVSSSQYCEHVLSLDEFTGELIENIHELQSLDVNRNEEKEKQKSEAKHINLRKRKALSDLFKYLAKLGLSYRKGLAVKDVSDEALKVAPVDLSVSLQSESRVQDVWSGCLQYFYKCVSRRAQFHAALVLPSKELGVGNIERCRGFAEHLYKLLLQQHREVTSLARQYKQICQLVSDVDRLNTSQKVAVPQAEGQGWNDTCKDLVAKTLEGLNQFLVILHCCPQQQGEVTLHPSPVAAANLHQMALVKQGDEEIKKTINDVQNLLSEVQISQTALSGVHAHLLTWSDVDVLKSVFAKMSALVPRMQQMCKLFTDPDSNQPNAFTEVLHFLSDEIISKTSDFETWHKATEGQGQRNDLDIDRVSEFSEKLEQLISSILLVVQKQSKHHVAMETETVDDNAKEDAEEVDMCEGHLVKVIYERLQQDRQSLDGQKTVGSLQSLLQMAVETGTSSTYEAKIQVLHHCAPLLSQYRNIVHHHLISNLATQRTMGKLLSVLLGVFTDLASKGFCIPPELSDEMSGEGATEFCDMEDAGMGEGEGVKNVSDQIEDEGQLDEAKRPEDHKKDDSTNQPDVKSEENAIEMSEDFDAKAQDLEDVDKEDDDEENDDKDEEEVDKQMGEVDDMDNEKLDEQMWGSDEEENVDEEQKEESGPGDGKQSEPELVAKDDNADKSETDREREQANKDDKEEEETDEIQKQHNLDMDQDNYDDDQVDPYHGKQEEQQAPGDLDLPDDLQLDNDNEASGDEEKQMEEKGEDQEDDTNLPQENSAEDKPEPDEEQEADDKKEQENEGDIPEEENQMDDTAADGTETAENDEREDNEGEDEPGFTPQDDSAVNTEENENPNEAEDATPAVEHYGKTSHDATENVEQSDTAQDMAGQTAENEQQEVDGTGQASADQVEGHQGQRSTMTADTSSNGKRRQQDRQPGKSDSDRSLGSNEQKYKKLKTTDTTQFKQDETQNNKEYEEQTKSDLYEHVKDSKSHYDAQTLDVATAEQQEEQGQITQENEEDNSDVEDDVEMAEDEKDTDDVENAEKIDELLGKKLQKKSKTESENIHDESEDTVEADGQVVELPGERIATETVARGDDSTIHTAMEHLYLDSTTFDLESLRSELETQLGSWTLSNLPTDTDAEAAASDLWHRYEALTSSLAQDLCEQLRLVLEPSQATKLKGDYRTGKRLNMRKVIPYIASQFRKDKIWLRRTKPSKRQYQIMLAIDDSSSMVDNHSKQMAFESLALISNALTLLESGQLSICSFGETVNVLHPFTEQFTSLSGAHLLQYLTFEQKKTKIAHLLNFTTAMMIDARNKQQGTMGNPETSQLLLIVSDGRGLFMEGMEVVMSAVRQAREANVFIVFVIIDNPQNKDSILDIKVPVFKQAGQIPEIKSYMDSFPFPFYIILRDINSLPIVLSDALRQWFELVTAIDR